jgi:hypothetical protein
MALLRQMFGPGAEKVFLLQPFVVTLYSVCFQLSLFKESLSEF